MLARFTEGNVYTWLGAAVDAGPTSSRLQSFAPLRSSSMTGSRAQRRPASPLDRSKVLKRFQGRAGCERRARGALSRLPAQPPAATAFREDRALADAPRRRALP